jgi:phosphate/sulfate permease
VFTRDSEVTNTISSGLLCFPEGTHPNPISFTLLMLSTLVGSGVWLMVATFLSLPVSTTHSIIGSVIGCGIVMSGFKVVCYKEVLMLGVWWIASPVIGFVASLLCWFLLKKLVIHSSNPRKRTRIVLPFLTAFTTVVLILFLIYKGAKGILPKSLNDIWYLWSLIIPASALIIGIFIAVFTWLVVLPWIKRRVEDPEYMTEQISDSSSNIQALSDCSSDTQALRFEKKDILNGNLDEQFMNDKNESLSFNVLVVLTSCCIAMAHGSNDIANASGPLSAIIYTYNTGRLPEATTENVKWATWVTGIANLL